MAKRDKDSAAAEEFDGGDDVTITNGVREITVSKKAFKSVYANKGFYEGSLESGKAAKGSAKAKGSAGEADDDEDDADANLSPQQKAARTKAANQAAKDAAAKGE